MAVDGDTRLKFGRNFTFINPDATVGPGTWRLSTIDEIAGGGTGGGGVLTLLAEQTPSSQSLKLLVK